MVRGEVCPARLVPPADYGKTNSLSRIHPVSNCAVFPPHSLGSTGSLSKASTPKAHSRIR